MEPRRNLGGNLVNFTRNLLRRKPLAQEPCLNFGAPLLEPWWNLGGTLVKPWWNLVLNLLATQNDLPERARDTTKLEEPWKTDLPQRTIESPRAILPARKPLLWLKTLRVLPLGKLRK